MKNFVIALFIILPMTITCFSQNILNITEKDTIIQITPQQLKETNLIFVEHYKLLKENNLLNQQVHNLQIDNNLLLKKDSLRTMQVRSYERLNTANAVQINKLKSEIKEKNKKILALKIGCTTVSIGLLVWLLLK